MIPPISVTASMFFHLLSVQRRRSFSITSAARLSKVVVTPVATTAKVWTEQGATSMPMARNEPLAMEALTSFTG